MCYEVTILQSQLSLKLTQLLKPFDCIVLVMDRVIQPLCLGQLLKYFKESEDLTIPTLHAYLYATVVVLGSVLPMISNHVNFFTCEHIGMQMRISINSTIYRKVS